MGNQLDLHMHSNISNDGEYSPSKLVRMCCQSGLRTISLTDHNSVRGIAEARNTAKRFGLEFVNGIELDCQQSGVNLHLLGYGIDPEFPAFAENELDVIKKEQAASALLIQRVQDLGIYFEQEKVMAMAIQGVVTGEMIAEAALGDKRNLNNQLLEPYRQNGERSDNPYVNFYWDFCSQGKPAYVPVEFISLQDAIALINSAGGLPVLAHPGINIGMDKDKLREAAACGIAGVEVYSSYHNGEVIEFLREQAERLNLFMTMGSDFHGKIKPAIKLGALDLPQEEELRSSILGKLRF